MSFILAIDQGTTSSRSIIFDKNLKIIGSAQEEFTQHFPQSGWVEHNPKDLLNTTIDTCKSALNQKSISPKKQRRLGLQTSAKQPQFGIKIRVNLSIMRLFGRIEGQRLIVRSFAKRGMKRKLQILLVCCQTLTFLQRNQLGSLIMLKA